METKMTIELLAVVGRLNPIGMLSLTLIPVLFVIMLAYSRGPIAGSATCFLLFFASLWVSDIETDELLGYLNGATIQTGLQLMADRKDMKGKVVPARHFKNLATDNEDAETADVFMQLAVMGEIVYG